MCTPWLHMASCCVTSYPHRVAIATGAPWTFVHSLLACGQLIGRVKTIVKCPELTLNGTIGDFHWPRTFQLVIGDWAGGIRSPGWDFIPSWHFMSFFWSNFLLPWTPCWESSLSFNDSLQAFHCRKYLRRLMNNLWVCCPAHVIML